MEFIAKTGIQRPARSRGAQKQWRQHRIAASGARKDKVFIERSLQRTGIRNSQHRAGFLDVVRYAQPGFGLARDRKTVVDIAAHAQIQRPVSLCNVIPHIQREFLHIGVAVKVVETPAAGQVIGQQNRIKIRVKGRSWSVGIERGVWLVWAGTLRGISYAWRRRGYVLLLVVGKN